MTRDGGWLRERAGPIAPSAIPHEPVPGERGLVHQRRECVGDDPAMDEEHGITAPLLLAVEPMDLLHLCHR